MPVSARVVSGCLVLATLLAGTACSPQEPGTPVPVSSPVPTTADVPQVEHPLDLSAFVDRLCDLLPPRDLVALDLEEYGRAIVSTGMCFLEDGLGTGAMALQLELDRSPVAVAYEHREEYEVFKPSQIRGLPAVAKARMAREKACTVVVGTTSHEGLTLIRYPDVGQGHGAAADMCTLMNDVMDTILRNAGA